MLDGIDILKGDPRTVTSAEKDFWIGELQMRLIGLNSNPFNSGERNLCAAFGLRMGQAKVLKVLSQGNPVSYSALAIKTLRKPLEEYQSMNGGRTTTIAVTVSQIRKLCPQIKIENVRGFGYRCPPKSCGKIKAVMAGVE